MLRCKRLSGSLEYRIETNPKLLKVKKDHLQQGDALPVMENRLLSLLLKTPYPHICVLCLNKFSATFCC